MRTLAIDLGARRVGLAISDEAGKHAWPLEVLEVSSPDKAVDAVAEVVAREDVARLVVGVPLNMDGTVGPAAKSAIQWGSNLSNRVNVPVVFVDERLSSFQAEQELASRRRAGEKLTRKRRKERLDAIAASSFLQEFLDGRLSPLTPPT